LRTSGEKGEEKEKKEKTYYSSHQISERNVNTSEVSMRMLLQEKRGGKKK